MQRGEWWDVRSKGNGNQVMWGFVDHCKDIGFNSKYDGESLEGVELETNMI